MLYEASDAVFGLTAAHFDSSAGGNQIACYIKPNAVVIANMNPDSPGSELIVGGESGSVTVLRTFNFDHL